jgi:mycothiol synthase
MTVDLPLDLSPEHRFTVEVRPFREGDEDTLIGINRAAFGEHPEAGSLDTGELSVLMAEPWFDPDGVLFHEADGSVVAFCWTKVHDDEGNTEGEIYRIGVDADNRGGGLGAGMVVAGFEYLAGQGIRRGFLWVDEANTPAVKLYRNLGMTTRSRNREFIRSGRGAGS